VKLEPDLIGEHHVAATGDVELIDSCLEWIEAEPVSTHQTRRRGCGSQWDNRETSPKDQQKNRLVKRLPDLGSAVAIKPLAA
jgi:hypothetical protein